MVGINPDDCSDKKLKHFLVEISNVLEGKGEKIVNQTKEYLDNKKKANSSNPKDMENVIKVFSSIQLPLDKKREEAKLYENKNYFEVENENKFSGSSEQ